MQKGISVSSISCFLEWTCMPCAYFSNVLDRGWALVVTWVHVRHFTVHVHTVVGACGLTSWKQRCSYTTLKGNSGQKSVKIKLPIHITLVGRDTVLPKILRQGDTAAPTRIDLEYATTSWLARRQRVDYYRSNIGQRRNFHTAMN